MILDFPEYAFITAETIAISLTWMVWIKISSNSSLNNFMTALYCACMHVISFHALMHYSYIGFITIVFMHQIIVLEFNACNGCDILPLLEKTFTTMECSTMLDMLAVFTAYLLSPMMMSVLWTIQPLCTHSFDEILEDYCMVLTPAGFMFAAVWEFTGVFIKRLTLSFHLTNFDAINNAVVANVITINQFIGLNFSKSLNSPALLLTFFALCPSSVSPMHILIYTFAPLGGHLTAKPAIKFLAEKCSMFKDMSESQDTGICEKHVKTEPVVHENDDLEKDGKKRKKNDKNAALKDDPNAKDAHGKKEKSTDCDSALIPLLCVHG